MTVLFVEASNLQSIRLGYRKVRVAMNVWFLFRNDSKMFNVLKYRLSRLWGLKIRQDSKFLKILTIEPHIHHIFERIQSILDHISDHASPSSIYAASISEYLTILYQSFINFMERITARFTVIKSCSPQLPGISVVSNDNRTFSRFS